MGSEWNGCALKPHISILWMIRFCLLFELWAFAIPKFISGLFTLSQSQTSCCLQNRRPRYPSCHFLLGGRQADWLAMHKLPNPNKSEWKCLRSVSRFNLVPFNWSKRKTSRRIKKIEFFTFLFHRFMSVVGAFTLEIYSISPTHNFCIFHIEVAGVWGSTYRWWSINRNKANKYLIVLRWVGSPPHFWFNAAMIIFHTS